MLDAVSGVPLAGEEPLVETRASAIEALREASCIGLLRGL
jgi:hypothetical protein